MAIFGIIFSGGPNSDVTKNVDVTAKNSNEAFLLAYQMPEAKQPWKYTSMMVHEIENGPSVIGICFEFVVRKNTFRQYMFIRADNEEQAKNFYRKHIRGKTFFESHPGKPDENGNCVYGGIRNTYYAITEHYDFDATNV